MAGVIKAIAKNAKTQGELFSQVGKSYILPSSSGAAQPKQESILAGDRLSSFGASNRQSNPLAAAIGAEAPSNNSSSIPNSAPTEERAFFKGATPYNPPIIKK